MTFLVIVEINDITQVFRSHASNVGGLDLGGWGRTKVVLSLFIFQVMLFLFILPSLFIGGFSALKIVKKGCFLSLSLKFINFEIFYRIALTFNNGRVDWPGISKIMLVCFINSKVMLKCHFGFNVNYFLYYILKVV